MRLLPVVAALAIGVGMLASGAGRAECDATTAVRGYFSALNRQDFGGALALTDGAAQASTSNMVNQLKSEAAAHHARVELKVTRVDVRPPGVEEPGRGVPVPVQFQIDVVGHKFCFKKVARKLEGFARFWVDPARRDRIVAIDGKLD
jgi:hypothetical protein